MDAAPEEEAAPTAPRREPERARTRQHRSEPRSGTKRSPAGRSAPAGSKRQRSAAPPPRKRKRRRRRKKHTGLWVFLTLLLLIALGACAAAGVIIHRASLADTVLPGVRVGDVDLSGMDRQQVSAALQALGAEKYDGLTVTARLPLDNTLTVSAHDARLAYSVEQPAQAAWNYGRDGSLLQNAVTWFKAVRMGSTDFAWDGDVLDVVIDEDAIRAIVADAAVSINEQLLTSGVDISDGEIRVTKGASGLTLDQEAVTAQLKAALLSGEGGEFTYEAAPEADEMFDFQSIHDELYAEKVEAHLYLSTDYDEDGQIIPWEPWASTKKDRRREKPAREIPELPEGFDFGGELYKITQSQVGVDFDVARAEELWAAASYGDTVTVPLIVTEPDMSTEDYENMLFGDVLSKNWTMAKIYQRDYAGECRTSLRGSTTNRISNVKMACAKIDGVILMPGQVFSYNETVGKREESAGWLPAPAYANGEVRQEAGGGICQVSSTLYNAVMYADLEVVERQCHQFQVGYLPWGMDATVSWGWPDFKFRNNNQYPIKIHAWVDEDTNECCVQILGTDTEHIYVIVRFSYAERFDTTGRYHDANGNALSVGMNAATWRQYYHDGEDYATTKPFDEVYEYYSQYDYHSEDIAARNVPLPQPPAEEGDEG